MGTKPAIISFNGEFSFLSNFTVSPLVINDWHFATVEHAYQAYKAANDEDRLKVQSATSPSQAKTIGNTITMCKKFEQRKEAIMEMLLRAKFSDYHPQLLQSLLETDNAYLVEGNMWHDNYWGDCICRKCANIYGGNRLGKLLMRVRKMRQQEKRKEEAQS